MFDPAETSYPEVIHPKVAHLMPESLQTICNPENLDPENNPVDTPTILIGAGTCGISAGAHETLKSVVNHYSDSELKPQLIEVGCIGLCSEEPIMEVQLPGKNRLMFGKVTHKKAGKILKSLQEGTVPTKNIIGQHRKSGESAWDEIPYIDEHPFFSPQTRLVLEHCGVIDPDDIDEYLKRDGYKALAKALHGLTPAELCDEVVESGLRGRGGGGFIAGKKWTFALNTPADHKYMICNADEGDPGAFMDRAIIEGDPHRLIEGLALASYAIGADSAYIYIRAEYPLAITRLNTALAQAREYGLLGDDILGSGFNLHIKIKKGAGAFVCGEETALIHSIEGKRGMPRPRPPFPAVSGLHASPSVINNVETLANIPYIVREGASAFNKFGTDTSKGTKVFALSGKINRTGLVEIAMGTPLREIINDIGGGIPDNKQYKAVQIGGPSGGCIPSQHLDIKVDYETLKTVGAMMGSGGLVVMDEDTCMVDVAKFFMDFIQRESCGKCIPCREGTRTMLGILEDITRGRKSESGMDALDRFKGVMYMDRLAGVIKDTSLCGLGQSAPNPILSTLRWFRDEYEAHVFDRKCPAGVCPELVTYSILEDKCNGCHACATQCPSDAILGTKKNVHHIVVDNCIACGACIAVCTKDAVIKE